VSPDPWQRKLGLSRRDPGSRAGCYCRLTSYWRSLAPDHYPRRRGARREDQDQSGGAPQGHRGKVKVKAKGRRAPSYAAKQAPKNNVLTSLQAICLAERCALMSGRDIDFVMNVFAAWRGVRWGELMGVTGMK
jgi:hypothetical protein